MSKITVTAEDVKKQGNSVISTGSILVGVGYLFWSSNKPVIGVIISALGILGVYAGLKMVLNAQDAVQEASDSH